MEKTDKIMGMVDGFLKIGHSREGGNPGYP